jgi:hypothetical protein
MGDEGAKLRYQAISSDKDSALNSRTQIVVRANPGILPDLYHRLSASGKRNECAMLDGYVMSNLESMWSPVLDHDAPSQAQTLGSMVLEHSLDLEPLGLQVL